MYIVCEKCKKDRLGACDDYQAEQGYDAFCFECCAATHKVEIPENTFTKKIFGIEVTAYNDSNSEWVVRADCLAHTHRFEIRRWTRRDAMVFVAKLAINPCHKHWSGGGAVSDCPLCIAINQGEAS
jgi:hypothetical protein